MAAYSLPPEASMLDPHMAASNASPYPQEIPPPLPETVDNFLRKKRKAREHKSCYPCRQRKVKCDLSRPCQTCRDRDHPELCSYHPPNKRQNVEQSQLVLKTEDPGPDNGSVTLGRVEFDMLCSKLNGLEHSIADLRHDIRQMSVARSDHRDNDASRGAHELNGTAPCRKRTHTDVHGLHTMNNAGEFVHLGAGSIPAMIHALGQGQGQNAAEKIQIQELLSRSILPLFALDNESATYPFVDLWALPHGSLQRARDLAQSLPSNEQLFSLFRCYQDLGWVIYPGVADLDQLEQDLTQFATNRAAQPTEDDGVTEDRIHGKTYYWLGMLFAVLASGVQCSGRPRKERELTSQVYVCCAFECLRFTNFLSQAHIESIQALLVIGNVLANNMNAGTAWSLLGLTIRLAQGLGLHRNCPPDVPKELVYPRARVWWAVIWQDSLLSMTYDRWSSSASEGLNTMPMPQNVKADSVGPYHAIMYRVFKVSLDIIRDRASASNAREHHARIIQHRDSISSIMRDSADYLRDSRRCTTPRDSLEHWGLWLHTSYALSELCRPAISPSTSDPELTQAFRPFCVDNLVNTVDAYLGLNALTAFARQSWSAMHRALSSALLLGILGEHTRHERARQLIARFVAILEDLVNNADPQDFAAPMQRGIEALRKLDLAEPVRPVGGGAQYNGGSREAQSATPQESMPREGEVRAKSEHAAMVTPAYTDPAGPAADDSPYSVLNAILWGPVDQRNYPEVPSL